MRVLHLPHNISGGTWRLVEAERRLGIESELLTFRSGFPGTDRGGVNLALENHRMPANLWKRFLALLTYCSKFDVFHFNWGDSFINSMKFNINHWDMPLLSVLGKKMVTTFQGCDIRRKSISLENFDLYCCTFCDEKDCGGRYDRRKASVARKVGGYSDKVFVSTPDLLLVLPQADVLPQVAPDPVSNQSRYQAPRTGEVLRVFHSPTWTAKKGTTFLVNACKRLSDEGNPLELVLSEGRPWDENARLMRSCHLVVDQLCAGWYGGVSVEAMTWGLPAICFVSDELRLRVTYGSEVPLINADINSIYDVLEECLKSPEILNEHGRKGPPFAKKYHSPDSLALVTARAYGFLGEEPPDGKTGSSH
ncbi:MAG: hypothetical protein KKB90_03240 [Actinobacteria bacterium]|nr:hypothetical protein [Actinomycetota bacterium]MCG2817476.1 hypothetical protein [Actinomycetes bacterium]MBU4357926.1 hypothetical protein [Actinomycetota bacterium]MBU4393023.1 hypothetical protein [Actinomycetota bacterium]MBU4402146.1 hypothetical protein [Actinomycetota bacterium]